MSRMSGTRYEASVYPDIQAFRDRHGQRRHYFRRRGDKRIPLPGLPGSDEFMSAYQAALAATPQPPEIGAKRTTPGTINALVVSYYQSTQWTGLNVETQRNRKPYIERFRLEHGNKRLVLLQRDHIERMMAKISERLCASDVAACYTAAVTVGGAVDAQDRPD